MKICKIFFSLSAVILFCCFSLSAGDFNSSLSFSEELLELDTSLGKMILYRPNLEEMERTAPIAKAIFVEAFSTTYTQCHHQSGAKETIESWLRLRPGLTLQSWLSLVFDEEYEEYLNGSKGFIYLCNSKGALVGWLSHSPVSKTGDLYLSQCSLEAASRNHRVATAAFNKVLEENFIKLLFPDVKEIKLIARKINKIAHCLYTKAGFTVDETIDPTVYDDAYDDRYIGFRLTVAS